VSKKERVDDGDIGMKIFEVASLMPWIVNWRGKAELKIYVTII
jgi:hypothetical protein